MQLYWRSVQGAFIISLGTASLVQHSEVSGSVIALKAPSLSTEPLWFAVSFDRRETELHDPSRCPAFLPCPSEGQLNNLHTLGGMALGDIGAFTFWSRPYPPRFHDVSGFLGLNPRSWLVEKNLITLSATERGTKLDFAVRDTLSGWNTVAWFDLAQRSYHRWNSRADVTFRNSKGKLTRIRSNALVEWDPLSGDVVLPHEARSLFNHVLDDRVFIDCSRLEKHDGLAPFEVILGDTNSKVRVTISMVKSMGSKKVSGLLGFKTTVCPTNVRLSSNSIEIGMKSVLDKYDVVLDGSLNRVSFVDKSSTVTVSALDDPIHPGLRTFRLIPELGGSFAGWVWRQTGERTDKDFIFLSQWPFGNEIEIAPARLNERIDSFDSVVPGSSVKNWAGKPKFTLRTEGYVDMEVEEEASWILTELKIERQSNRVVIMFKEKGKRYVWDDESRFNGPDQRLIARPSASRTVPDDEFYVRGTPTLNSDFYRRNPSRIDEDKVRGIWFGKPVMRLDSDNRFIITSDGSEQDHLLIHRNAGHYMYCRFRKVNRYIPVISGTSNILFKHVFGPTRYDDEFDLGFSSLSGENGHWQISLYPIADRPKSLEFVYKSLKALEGVKFGGDPVSHLDPATKDITIAPRPNGQEHTITVEYSSDESVIVSFDARIARFIVPREASLAGSRFVFLAKSGRYEEGEVTLDSLTPRIEPFGNRQYRMSLKNVVHRYNEYYSAPLFQTVGIWYGAPQLSLDQRGNLVLSGKGDGEPFKIHVYENRDPVEVIFTPVGNR